MSTQTSKFLSYVLRHAPESINLSLDAHGWADIDALIEKARNNGQTLDLASLQRIVAESDKKRFTISDDGKRIRAAQGHSVSVNLALSPHQPPDVLYHGTATRFLANIEAQGLVSGSRQQVHLSADIETAQKVGQRHGKPVVLVIDTKGMFADGLKFYHADNGVWLTDTVPVNYISFPSDRGQE